MTDQPKNMSVKCHKCKDTGSVYILLPAHPHLVNEWPCPDCRAIVTAADKADLNALRECVKLGLEIVPFADGVAVRDEHGSVGEGATLAVATAAYTKPQGRKGA